VEETLLKFHDPPQRVVSLVPSITESLFDLGAGPAVVGVTDYCVFPAVDLETMPRVGGTRKPDLSEIINLAPDLVIANQEENSKETVNSLKESGIEVLHTFPRTVRQALDVLNLLARLFQLPSAIPRLDILERTIEWAELETAGRPRRRFFCPIWFQHSKNERWWMTFNQDTYAHDLLRILGGENIFSDRERQYPFGADLQNETAEPAGMRDSRYPRVQLGDILAHNPDVILLPDEPFAFKEEDAVELRGLYEEGDGGPTPQITFIDGSLIFWHGTRLGLAVQQLGDLFSDHSSIE
jgi:iron complex transport system substrate-binding protein